MPDKIHLNCSREELNLPNEILAIIINELASDAEENDRIVVATLASCRLASQVLCSLATPLFFSSMHLTESFAGTNPNDRLVAFKERATKLDRILTVRDVAASVQTFTLRCDTVNLENSINSTLISSILRRLPYIRNFTLESEGDLLDFSSITEDCTSAIQAFGISPNLTTLGLGNIGGFPITVITACPNLRCLRLSLVGFCFDNVHPMDQISNLQPFHLDTLEIDRISTHSLALGVSDNKSLAEYFSRIKNLRIKNLFFDDSSLAHGWDIISLASRSLTTLDLPMDYVPQLEVHPFDLRWFPALRHFKIQLLVYFLANANVLSFLAVLLSNPTPASCIETLEIKITWDGVENEKDLFSPDAGWTTLDGIINSRKFVSLRKVVLNLCLEIETGTIAFYNEQDRNLERERNLILPYINALFPKFRASKNNQRTLEIHVEII